MTGSRASSAVNPAFDRTTVGSFPISSKRAHASRAIPPVALGIEPKPSALATCMAAKPPGRCRSFRVQSQMIGVPYDASSLPLTMTDLAHRLTEMDRGRLRHFDLDQATPTRVGRNRQRSLPPARRPLTGALFSKLSYGS